MAERIREVKMNYVEFVKLMEPPDCYWQCRSNRDAGNNAQARRTHRKIAVFPMLIPHRSIVRYEVYGLDAPSGGQRAEQHLYVTFDASKCVELS